MGDIIEGKDKEVSALKRELRIPNLELGDDILYDQEKYYSKEILNQEWDRLWTKVWTIAGRLSDVRKVGDWFTYELGNESFIIVRSAEDRVQAFYNVCQHRGSRLVDQDFGHGNAFVCPFHSWSWNVDGSLRNITDEETFPKKTVCDRPGMSEVRCESWGGFVFINMNDDAEPLSEFLGTLGDAMAAYHMENMVVAKDYSVDWPLNWKLALDAFMEGYHAHARHPELVRMIDDFNFDYDVYGNGHSSMVIPMGTKTPRISNREPLTEELRMSIRAMGLDPADFENRQTDVRPAMIKAKREWMERYKINAAEMSDDQLIDDGNYNVFPNITFNAHPEGVLIMRFRPHATDPGRCFYDAWVISHPSEDPQFDLPFYMAVPPGTDLSVNGKRPERHYTKHGDEGLGLVVDQDAEFLPLVHAGVQSRGFKGVRLSNQEIRLRYYYTEYDRYLRGEK